MRISVAGTEIGPEIGPAAAVWGLTFLTGAAGLVYQVVWQRYLARLAGSDAVAVATILGVFLGGLSAGYALCGRMTLRAKRLLVAYGWLEGFIGIWALSFPWLFAAVDAATQGWSFTSPGMLVLQTAFCAVLLVGPPTICMGATVPVLTRALTCSIEEATRVHARVYAVNTAGAVVGALAAGFLLVPALGLPVTLRLSALANLAAAALFIGLGARRPRDATPAAPVVSHRRRELPRPAPAWALHAIAFTGGVAFMTLESLLVRVTRLSFGSSSYSFALIVAVCVLSIAIGGFVVARHARVRPASLLYTHVAIVGSLMVLFVTLDKWPWAAHVIRVNFSGTPTGFAVYHFTVFVALLAALVVPAGCMGATLPLAFDALKRELDSVGRDAGTLFAWNAAGNFVGGIGGGYLLFRWLDSGEVLLVVLLLAAIGGLLASVALSRRHRWAAAGALVVTVGFIAAFPGHDPLRFAVGTFRLRSPVETTFAGPDAFYSEFYRQREVLAFRDDPSGTYAVVENPSPAIALAARFPDLVESMFGSRLDQLATLPRPRAIVVNGKPDSSTFYDLETLKLLAHLPALFSEHRERMLIIGLGTGVTAGELTLYPEVERIEVAEIAPAVAELLPYFSESTHAVHEDERLTLHVGDAFRVLRRGSGTYDAISSEPSNPWMSGVDQLFSREFYRLARERLAHGGCFIQWIQRYGTSERITALAVNTLRAEFPHVRVFRTEGTDDLLLASLEPLDDGDFERARRSLAANLALRQSLASIGIDGLEALRSREHPEVVAAAASATGMELETLDRPRLHYLAGRAFFSGESVDDPARQDF